MAQGGNGNSSDSFFLHPGTILASNKPVVVTTILGSCVSVCLWDPALRIGGINHYLLPLWNGEGLPLPKYGNIAISRLVEMMLSEGSRKGNLKAKVFGGASINVHDNGLLNVGKRNVILARDLLEEEGIPIVSSHLEGNMGRKLIFFSETGVVRMKLLKKSKRAGK